MKDMNWPERVAYLENQLADSDRDNKRLREFIEGLPDGDEIVRLRGLLTRIHGIAAEPRPVNMAVRLENIACIASWERDETYAQLAEEQRFLHGAAADAQQVPEGMALYKGEFVTARMVVERLAEAESAYLSAWARLVKEERLHGYAMEERDHAMKIAAEGTSNAAYWHKRAMKAEARLAEAVECCTIKDNRNLRLEAKVADLERQLHWALTGDMPTDSAEGGAK